MFVIDEVSVMGKDAAGSALCAGTAFTQSRHRQNTSNERGICRVGTVAVFAEELWGPGERFGRDYILVREQVHRSGIYSCPINSSRVRPHLSGHPLCSERRCEF